MLSKNATMLRTDPAAIWLWSDGSTVSSQNNDLLRRKPRGTLNKEAVTAHLQAGLLLRGSSQLLFKTR